LQAGSDARKGTGTSAPPLMPDGYGKGHVTVVLAVFSAAGHAMIE
jgi:hypothetical protein